MVVKTIVEEAVFHFGANGALKIRACSTHCECIAVQLSQCSDIRRRFLTIEPDGGKIRVPDHQLRLPRQQHIIQLALIETAQFN